MSPVARQLLAMLWLVTTLLVAAAWHAGTPVDAEALRPRAAQAHSLAAETLMLATLAAQQRLPAAVTQRQAGQLLQHVRDATREMAGLRVRADLAATRDALRPPLLAVERALEQLQARQPVDAPALEGAAGHLATQARALDRKVR